MKNNIIGFKLGVVIMSVFLIVLLSLGIVIDRMFTSFYYQEMQTEAEELASHFTAMAESKDTTNGQMMMSFAEFSNVSIFNISLDGKVMLHSGVHDSTDRSFIRDQDMQAIFTGQRVSFLYKDPSGYRYFVTGQPISSGDIITSALYVMSSTENMEHSLSTVRDILLLSGLGAFCLLWASLGSSPAYYRVRLSKCRRLRARLRLVNWKRGSRSAVTMRLAFLLVPSTIWL